MPDEPTREQLQRENERLREIAAEVRKMAKWDQTNCWSGRIPRKITSDVIRAYEQYAQETIAEKLEQEDE